MNLPPRRNTRRDLVIDNYHGTKVADPYRWLEDDTAPEVQQWADEQNADFEKYISLFDIRQSFKSRLTKLWDCPKVSTPVYEEGYYYTARNNGLQNQYVYYRCTDLNQTGELIFDPNLLSEDGTVAVVSGRISPKGNYFAFGLSTNGSDWQVIKILDLKTRKNLSDVILHTQYTNIAWLPDESGFVYSRYPEPKSTNVLEMKPENAMVYLHTLGQQQSDDTLIHSAPENPEWDFYFFTDEDKKWAFLTVYCGQLNKSKLYYKPFVKLYSAWLPIADDFVEGEGYKVIGVVDNVAYCYTRIDAPFGKVMRLKLTEKGAENWQTAVPEQSETMESVTLVNNHLLVCSLFHSTHRLHLYNLDGTMNKAINLPPLASVIEISGNQNREEFFIEISGYLYPSTILRYDFSGKEPTVWFAQKIDFPFHEYESYQVFCTSKDGTKIPLFITHRKDMQKDGKNPVLLYGYGGFDISEIPLFSLTNLVWLEKGGIYVAACLRGGLEYGETWYQSGKLGNKQNVFDDFISAGEYLINQNYTTAEKLGIFGESNGGLLTGACLTQRPDLYGAVVVGVPIFDMLRHHCFPSGRYTTGEYGCAEEDPEQFKYLYKYSPLHNVKINVVYPPTLIMTADTDDRCVPSHARKFTATLQAADAGENPILLKTEKNAGHGCGKPISKIIDASADLCTFLYVNLFSRSLKLL